jgi:hypothetical protein
MILWLPSKNSRRFAYAELGQDECVSALPAPLDRIADRAVRSEEDEMEEFVNNDFKGGETQRRARPKDGEDGTE